ncbi:hypothetical protein ACIQWR_11865 [Streptomyces sp. NPDC098789]|uniref:hypothetical protein n=1 Tax=Streptomyces sp. NPDC098789 TaxID=3366098 RepID=UPI003825704F
MTTPTPPPVATEGTAARFPASRASRAPRGGGSGAHVGRAFDRGAGGADRPGHAQGAHGPRAAGPDGRPAGPFAVLPGFGGDGGSGGGADGGDGGGDGGAGGGDGERPVERRLRAALSARAEQVTVRELRPADPPGRHLRRLSVLPPRRFALPLAGLAAAAAIAVGYVALAPDQAPRPVPPASPPSLPAPSPTPSPGGSQSPPQPSVSPSAVPSTGPSSPLPPSPTPSRGTQGTQSSRPPATGGVPSSGASASGSPSPRSSPSMSSQVSAPPGR